MFIHKGVGEPRSVTFIYGYVERFKSGDDSRRDEGEGVVVVSWDGE